MKMKYYPTGVCSQRIEVQLQDGIIKKVTVIGGCNGNGKGIAALLAGRKAEEVIPLLRGISCGGKPTSCPDQISYALEEALKMEEERKKTG